MALHAKTQPALLWPFNRLVANRMTVDQQSLSWHKYCTRGTSARLRHQLKCNAVNSTSIVLATEAEEQIALSKAHLEIREGWHR